MSTKVVSQTFMGAYNLECRAAVSPSKIRPINSEHGQSRNVLPPTARPDQNLHDQATPGILPSSSFTASASATAFSGSYSNLKQPSQDHVLPPTARQDHDLHDQATPDVSPSSFFTASASATAFSGSYSNFKQPSHATFDLNEPMQLLTVKREGSKWHYEVCPEGAELLRRQGSRLIAVISMCGLYRTGKSYILNLLLERVQRGLPLFQVGSTTRACTEGLWLWGATDSSDASSPLLAFIDCEGFGSTDSDRTRDAQLMTLCALLSSVLVLNTKGALSESVFNALSLVCRFAEHVEERGNQASRPALLWLLRDFQLDLLDPDGNPISPADYLERALHAAPLAGHDHERGQAAREVRQGLLKFFSQRSCHTLVRPVIDEEELQRLEQLPFSSLRKEFRNGVEGLKFELLRKCGVVPKTVAGQPLGCTAFVGLLQQLVTAMNESQILNVKGAWDTVQHTACGSLSDELRNQACAWLRALSSGQCMEGGVQLPMPDPALGSLIEEQRQRLRGMWEQQAVGDEATRMEYWRELLESLVPEEFLIKEWNNKIADQQLAVVCESWRRWLDDKHGTWQVGEQVVNDMSALMENVPATALSRAAAASIEAAGRQISKDRSNLSQLGDRVSGAEEKAAQLIELQTQVKDARRNEQTSSLELQACKDELSTIASQRQQLLLDLQASRTAQTEAKLSLRMTTEKAKSMQAELDAARGQLAQCQNECAMFERAAKSAHSEHESSQKDRQTLEAQLQKLRTDIKAERQKFTEEREACNTENARLLRELEDERRGHTMSIRDGQEFMKNEVDRLGGELKEARLDVQAKGFKIQELNKQLVETKAQVLTLETAKCTMREQIASIYRDQAKKEKSLREDLEVVKDAAAKSEIKALAADRAVRRARWEADTAAEAKKWMEDELARRRSKTSWS
jgi:hypothetical protein